MARRTNALFSLKWRIADQCSGLFEMARRANALVSLKWRLADQCSVLFEWYISVKCSGLFKMTHGGPMLWFVWNGTCIVSLFYMKWHMFCFCLSEMTHCGSMLWFVWNGTLRTNVLVCLKWHIADQWSGFVWNGTLWTNALVCLKWHTADRCSGVFFRLWSIAAHRDHFVRRMPVRPSVCLSGSHTFLVVTHNYVLQATYAFLGMLPIFFK